jgi:hypothetical protein
MAAVGLAGLAFLFARSRTDAWLQLGLAVATLALIVRILG